MENRNNETLSWAFREVAVIDAEEIDLLRARQYLHFALNTDQDIYCMDQDKQM